ncbi:MAG TPA: HDOD domain-containing protein [Acidiferrobacteraceae bacterium]|nr:HDOD domain-containing protein [Acidiferrobacteraceae bacterium]
MNGQQSSANLLSESKKIFVGRQPICNKQLEVVAYELLFRDSEANYANFSDENCATSQIIVNAVIDIGLDRIVNDKNAYINITRDIILGGQLTEFNERRLGLEILEGVPVDEKVVKAVQILSQRGHTILLDDFIFHEDLIPLVEIADIIKIDVLQLDKEAIGEHVDILQKHDVELLAEKIEGPEMFEFCKDLGFDCFQGYFFCKPKIIRGERIPADRLAIVQLLAKLQDPKTEFSELEKLVSKDVSMSYRLLRIINAAQYGLNRKVDSIKEALVILGFRAIRNWISLLSMSSIDGKPHELMVTAMVRAHMCELLAKEIDRKDFDTFFTVGLFSVLDALLDQPMDVVLKALPVSEEIKAALLGQEGPLGEALTCVLAYERGDWDKLIFDKVGRDAYGKLYLDAVKWADDVGRELKAA